MKFVSHWCNLLHRSSLKGVIFVTIGGRLKQERQRLGLSQTAFAEIASASKRSAIGWEKDASSPNATALSAFADAGVDVLYVVTGRRCSGAGVTALKAEAVMDEIDDSDQALTQSVLDVLREFAVYMSLPERTRARADYMLARHGDEEAEQRLADRDRKRERAFVEARRIVSDVRHIVGWQAPERVEAEFIRLIVDYGVDVREIEGLARAFRDSAKK